MVVKSGVPVFSVFETEEELRDRKVRCLEQMVKLAGEVLDLVTELSAVGEQGVETSAPMEELEVYRFLGSIESVNGRMRGITYYLRSQLDKIVK